MGRPDVIIAGAGPVGLLLGCLLGARGAHVVICERRTGTDDRTRAIGVHPPGLDALDAAGVGTALRAESVALDRGEVHARGRMLASIAFPAERTVRILPQRRTVALLRERLHALGVEVRTGCEVAQVTQDRTGVSVGLRGAAGETTENASLLIAADGVHSGLRAALGIRWCRRGSTARYSMVDAADADDSAIARLYCEPGGLVESFPLPGRRRRWVVRHPPGVPALSGEDFARAVHTRTGIAITPVAPSAFTAAQHRAARTVSGRIVLLGDAAHEISPIGGQGMNLGWVDARVLADALGQSGLGGLAAYERRAARAAADVQRRATFYMSMGAPARGIRQHAREGAIRLMGTAPLRNAAAALVTMRGI